MQGMRDESIWKNLALAFGDGLAFGVGVKISENAAARIAPARTDLRTLSERLNEIESRIEKARQNHTLPSQFNQKVVEAVVAVVDARLREQSERFERRLEEEIAGLRAEFGEQLALARKHAEDENHVLRGQMTALHRQFAESLAKLVDEQIASTMELRLAPVETELREEIRTQATRAAGMAAAVVDEQVMERMQPVETAVTDLSRRLEENDRNTLELVLALGQLCLQTAERLSEPAVEIAQAAKAEQAAVFEQVETKAEPEAPVATEPETRSGPVAEGARPEPLMFEAATPPSNAPWRSPLGSSFFLATGGLLLLHYL
jgi:hypothetical protein